MHQGLCKCLSLFLPWNTACLKHCYVQNGHDNWVRGLAFHPSGLYLLSASDDKTIRIWDLQTGRMSKTIDAHDHFVTCLVWGRTVTGGNSAGVNGDDKKEKGKKRVVNVMATGSVDQTIRVSSRVLYMMRLSMSPTDA